MNQALSPKMLAERTAIFRRAAELHYASLQTGDILAHRFEGEDGEEE